MSSLIARLHDAAVTPEAWPDALTALTDAAGVAGAALIVFNKSTGKVDEAHFCGLSAGFKSDYVRHYAALDPYAPLLDGSWKKLSECLPDRLLRSSEWYNDFILTCGVRDILGARLVDTSGHCVIFGIHQQIGRSFSDSVDSVVNLAGIPLEARRLAPYPSVSLRRDPLYLTYLKQRFRLKEAGFISTLTTAVGIRTKPGSPVFSTADDATEHAIVVAQELAQDGSWHGSSILVTDDRGHEIVRVRIGR